MSEGVDAAADADEQDEVECGVLGAGAANVDPCGDWMSDASIGWAADAVDATRASVALMSSEAASMPDSRPLS